MDASLAMGLGLVTSGAPCGGRLSANQINGTEGSQDGGSEESSGQYDLDSDQAFACNLNLPAAFGFDHVVGYYQA